MTERQLIDGVKECSDLFYQNNEQEAYEMLVKLIPEINNRLKEMVNCLAAEADTDAKMQQTEIVENLQELVMAYQCKDGLALADLLCYDISKKMEQLIALKQEAGI